RLAGLESQCQADAIGSEARTERNKIRLDFQAQLNEFRKQVLATHFTIRGQAEFFNSITDRDSVIHEILDMRLLPKRYQRDIAWGRQEGNSSIIYRLFNVDTHRHAIAMVIKMPQIDDRIRREVEQLADLRHRNVIKLLDHEISTFPFFVITEYVYGANLPDSLSVVGPRPVAQAADWLFQLTDGLDYLRHKHILHTNVRPSKIYIDDEWQIMLSPLDLIKLSPNKPRRLSAVSADPSKDNPAERTFNRYRDVCQYGSPELVERDGEGLEKRQMCVSDLYSLGLVGFKILTGKDLFEGQRVHDILASRRQFVENHRYRAARLAELPESKLSRLIVELLEEDPEVRSQCYPDLNTLLRALHPLTRTERPLVSETRASYRRALSNNREFFREFYSRFLTDSPHAGDFDEHQRKRQSSMLQMAMDVLLDLETKKEYLVRLISTDNPKHQKYSLTDFEQFLTLLIGMVGEYDPRWNPTLQAEWEKIRLQALRVIQEHRTLPPAATAEGASATTFAPVSN
ncbi:MAG TPA: protein kinase, partial [Saprospiraceae bacterium]|nr:protein kinase [Saprospiraceae bacterium]